MKDIIITLFAGIAAGVMFSIPLFLFIFFVDGLDIYLRTRKKAEIEPQESEVEE